jgi:hypothetical protein
LCFQKYTFVLSKIKVNYIKSTGKILYEGSQWFGLTQCFWRSGPRKLEQFVIHILIKSGRPVCPETQQMWNYFLQIAPE